MLGFNQKKNKHIFNKSIPSPLRPKFRNKNQTSMYFLSKKKDNSKKKGQIIDALKILILVLIIGVSGYLFLN